MVWISKMKDMEVAPAVFITLFEKEYILSKDQPD